jgi:hypothetical protein
VCIGFVLFLHFTFRDINGWTDHLLQLLLAPAIEDSTPSAQFRVEAVSKYVTGVCVCKLYILRRSCLAIQKIHLVELSRFSDP